MMESSNVDDRTEHEIYVAPFLRSVMAGVTSVMCSYNLVNGTYACENDHTLNQILKNELGFQGFVMSDWTAQHSTISAMAGLDMSMPGDIPIDSNAVAGVNITTLSVNLFDPNASFFGANLTAYVQNKTIPEARLDDMATRILASWYFLGQDSPNYPKTNFNTFFPLDEATNEHIDVQDDHGKLVREIGASSIVLLKNVDGALPLKKPRKIVLIGSDGGPARIAGPNEFPFQAGVDGVLAVGWGSGYVMHCLLRMSTMIRVSHRRSHCDVGPHSLHTKSRFVFRFVIGKRVCVLFITRFEWTIQPYEAFQARARKDHTSFSWFFDDFNLVGAATAAVQQDVALVFLQSDSGEGFIAVDGNAGDR